MAEKNEKKKRGILGFLGLERLGRQEWILIGLICALTFIAVYAPHFNSKFPLHVDEWRHITEAIKLKNGEFSKGWDGTEIGFHIFLAGISYFGDLVLIYRFLPALWAVVSGLVLFWVVFKKTEEFETSLFAMVFFASIKTNINLLGIWFFTPLSFAIPFIFLYVYYFTEGIERQKKNYLFISLGLMIAMIFIHSLSLLFAIPFLALYCLVEWRKSVRMWKTLLVFLLIPVIGVMFFGHLMDLGFVESAGALTARFLVFEHGWGVSEYDNSFLELYSWIGYIMAIFGACSLFILRKDWRKFLPYIFWPLSVLIMIVIFRFYGVSYLSPYQRNMYYLVIGLPLLSALGLSNVLKIMGFFVGKIKNLRKREIVFGVVTVIIVLGILSLAFLSYFDIPSQFSAYQVLDDDGYNALKFLSGLEKSGSVMAPTGISTAMFPVSGHEGVGTMFFYGDKKKVDDFFAYDDCENKTRVLGETGARYVMIKDENESSWDCGWTRLYGGGNYTIFGVR